MRPRTKKLNRLERNEAYKIKLESALFGEGLFEFRNQTKGDMHLAKPAQDGRRIIPAGSTFRGDSYFKGKEGITHTKTIQSVEAARAEKTPTNSILEESVMSEEKLIVDQPEKVTSEGTVEHVKKAPEPVKPLNEQKPHVEGKQHHDQDVLLNDAPISGVEILLNN